ncbi:MAG: tetratricopeptide repeat protein [Acidobacteriota bacterium]|nr:tetratricopeptide repeat protein [Acidobacteriota bacterium]
MKTTAIYCQSCRAANHLSETHCRECGTRLLLVVFPNSLQYDTNHVPTYYEDHLLERVTLLELRITQISERLESAFDLLHRGLDAFQKEQILLQSFLEIIERTNPEFAEILNGKSLEIKSEIKNKQTENDKKKRILSEILTLHKNPNAELFTHLIKEGIKLLSEKEEKEAFQMLERAALLSPNNVALHFLIAENLFRVDKYAEARIHLEKILDSAPTEPKLLLLLGAIYADYAETEKARRLLSLLTGSRENASVVNFIWGMLAAFEANWTEAIAAFKEATGKNKSAEVHYLIGCAYFQLKREPAALRYLQKAVSLDTGFSDAWFMLSIIYKSQQNFAGEKNAFETAVEQKESGAQSLEFLQGKKMIKLETALPFAHFQKKNARILTGGSLRLTKCVREMIFRAID